MSKSTGSRSGKDRAEPETSRHDSNEENMFSLEMMVAALRLVAEQRATERNVRRQQEQEDVGCNSISSVVRDRSPSITTVSSIASTSTAHNASVLVTTESSSSSPSSPRTHEAEYAGFQHVNAEERPERNRDEAGPIVAFEQPPSTLRVFAGWPNTSPLVTNVPGSLFQRYPTFNAALNAFMEASTNGHVAVIFV
ncbi:uncharacterized protein LAESUDRAFT_715459 [Laetiporus sulphureus 93-53]|uniref:Uncharacterized protein n=1 Tax=Laetiporus sulphureus 93-53 TaxID=1314785 RepID=A0A165DDW4_9APHY|nr:uncharacterized protein LAESUDRAFT_715459 [Laetiporus sulphureus 93-53]KZT04663.1 hypothetical protein LAESUDRAFT_715459 [Laetiporus sulphureus 93-53]